MAEDRVSLKNLVNNGGFLQPISRKKWTALQDENKVIKTQMPDGSTLVSVWVSFNNPSVVADRPKNFQFRIVRTGGDFTARTTFVVPSVTDVGLSYQWELSTGPTNPNTIWVEVWHDAANTINLTEYEAHYKHIPEVVVK